MSVSIMDKLKGEKKINFKLDLINLNNSRFYNKLYNLGLLIMTMVVVVENMLALGTAMIVFYILISLYDSYQYKANVSEITKKYLKVVSK